MTDVRPSGPGGGRGPRIGRRMTIREVSWAMHADLPRFCRGTRRVDKGSETRVSHVGCVHRQLSLTSTTAATFTFTLDNLATVDTCFP
jgi:hypothetical protein